MADRLPGQGQRSLAREEPEEDGNDDGQFLEIVAVDVDVGEEADEGAGADEAGPVPLPAAADGVEAALLGEVEGAMLGEGGDGQDEGEAVEDGKGDAGEAAGADGVRMAL